MSGVEESDYDELRDRVEVLDDLELVYHSQYKDVIRIRTLPGMTEEVWNHYDLHQLDGMKEQLLFRNALAKLKLSIKEIISNVRKQKPSQKSSQ